MPAQRIVAQINDLDDLEQAKVVLRAAQAKVDQLTHKDEFGAGAAPKGVPQGSDVAMNPGRDA